MRSRWGAVVFALLAVVPAACSSDADDVASTAGSTTVAEIAEIVERDEWGQRFEDADTVGAFAAREVGTDRTFVWNADRVAQGRIPASTFKILNSMIILQTGVVANVDEVVPWDGVVRDIGTWNRDHSLRSGIEVSAVWLYQELARRVGETRMSDWVTATEYGNEDIAGGIDQFWLRGDLRISPLEQLDFLERMVTGDLPFDPEVVAEVSEIIVREEGDGWSWSHKTGTAAGSGPVLGWLVGTTEYDDRTWVFAMNVDLESTDPPRRIDPNIRLTVSRRILEEIGALPPR